MNIFRSKILTKILPFLTARYTILCTPRLQPPLDDCAVQVQWFSSLLNNAGLVCDILTISNELYRANLRW